MQKVIKSKKTDFSSFIARQPEALWVFQELFSSSNGKDFSQAITLGTCIAVSDG